MNDISTEIFNILKGEGYKMRLYTIDGVETLNVEEATRLYAVDQNLIVTIVQEDNKFEVIVKIGDSYDIQRNKDILDAIKAIAHGKLGEFTMRKFDKQIQPKADAQVTEGFTKAGGSTKTSYIRLPEATLIIKHNKSVNEEVRGSRSRNIHSLFIESASGEKFAFPHKYMAGARAMTMHVNEQGNPYDVKGQAILAMCEEISDLNQFTRYTKQNKLVNEDNQDIVETIKSKVAELKESVKRLATKRGYDNFKVEVNEDLSEETLDISERFKYNGLSTDSMQKSLSTVNRVVSETKLKEAKTVRAIENLEKLINITKSGMKITEDVTDPEHPDNAMTDFSGEGGNNAAIGHKASYIGIKAAQEKQFELSNLLDMLSVDVHKMNKVFVTALDQLLDKMIAPSAPVVTHAAPSMDSEAVTSLRKMVG
jgi:hypothetical protein